MSNSSDKTNFWRGTVIKETQNSRVGISFTGDGTSSSPLIIAAVNPNGPFGRKTNLCAGLRVVSVNDINVASSGWSARDLGEAICCAHPGPLTIEATGVLATCSPFDSSSFCNKKTKSNNKLGIQLKKIVSENAIVVSDISPMSPLKHSGLRVGHRLTWINGELCPLCPQRVMELMFSDCILKIVAIDDTVENIAAMREKMISCAESSSSTPYFESAVPGQVTTKDGNDKQVDNKEHKMTLTSKDDHPEDLLVIKACKPYCYGNVGLILKKDEQTSDIYVKSISPMSIFQQTKLQVGHCIVAINGFKCLSSTRDAVKRIQDIRSHVWLEVVDSDIIVTTVQQQQPQQETEDTTMIDKENHMETTASCSCYEKGNANVFQATTTEEASEEKEEERGCPLSPWIQSRTDEEFELQEEPMLSMSEPDSEEEQQVEESTVQSSPRTEEDEETVLRTFDEDSQVLTRGNENKNLDIYHYNMMRQQAQQASHEFNRL